MRRFSLRRFSLRRFSLWMRDKAPGLLEGAGFQRRFGLYSPLGGGLRARAAGAAPRRFGGPPGGGSRRRSLGGLRLAFFAFIFWAFAPAAWGSGYPWGEDERRRVSLRGESSWFLKKKQPFSFLKAEVFTAEI